MFPKKHIFFLLKMNQFIFSPSQSTFLLAEKRFHLRVSRICLALDQLFFL